SPRTPPERRPAASRSPTRSHCGTAHPVDLKRVGRIADSTRMNAAFAAVAFAPALAVGSFLNVVASRLPVGQSLSRPRSRCPHCDTQIAARDNIPLVSFALLRGRCRSCDGKISWRYPAVELITAVLVAACVVAFGLSLEALAAAVFCVALVAISATDLER